MRFNPAENPHAWLNVAEPAADLRYAPNKLHGDEIESADGAIFREQHPHEWLSRGEIDELLQRVPGLELLLIDDNAAYPPEVYRVASDPMTAWRRQLSPLYVSDDGYSDQRVGWSLMAYRWSTAEGSEALVFRVNC